MTAAPLLSVRDLQIRFGSFLAVRGASFDVHAGRTLGLVGESGSGKSTIARAVAGLVPAHSGEMRLDGAPLRGLAPRKDASQRQALQMVFQNPDAALNPRLTIQRLIEEPLLMRGIRSAYTRQQRVQELLGQVGLPDEAALKQPHQLSGGQKQRVCIARALAAEPRLVIADEVVSALDVSVQGQILNLFADLQRDNGLAYLFISHNLSVVRHVADRVLVMFFGRIVEEGDQAQIWRAPQHPYTRALIAAVPVADPVQARARRREIALALSADAPPALSGCAYRSRCAMATALCEREEPVLREADGTHRVACHHAQVQEVALLPDRTAPLLQVAA